MDGGTLRLSGANTYTNSMAVRDGGTLIVDNASALGTTNGITYVQTGSKLNLNGFNIGTEKIDMQKANAELLNNAGTAATANGTISLSAAGQKIGGSGDLNLGGIISGTNGFEKTGAGTLTLSGLNTYSGKTTVSFGQLTLADNAGLTFVIGANGINNKIDGAATVSLGGDFTFDLTSAGTTVGDAWTIVAAGTLTETFESTFSVVGFTDAGSNLWTKDIDGSKAYEFSEATGVLTVIPEPATIGMLGLGTLITLILRRKMTI
jgi:autotransporter-associated beta strand protein